MRLKYQNNYLLHQNLECTLNYIKFYIIDFDDEIIALPTLSSTQNSEGKLFNLIYILRPENINMIIF